MKFCLLSTLPSRCKCGQAPRHSGVFFRCEPLTVHVASEECAPLMARARGAMNTGRHRGLTYAVHTLRGMFRSLSATWRRKRRGY